MTPDAARAWIGVLRDFAVVALGIYIVLHEVQSGDANEFLLGFAGTLFGFPALIRVDEWKRPTKPPGA